MFLNKKKIKKNKTKKRDNSICEIEIVNVLFLFWFCKIEME